MLLFRQIRPSTELFLFEDPPCTCIFIADEITQMKLKDSSDRISTLLGLEK